jgi:hypothetical protein
MTEDGNPPWASLWKKIKETWKHMKGRHRLFKVQLYLTKQEFNEDADVRRLQGVEAAQAILKERVKQLSEAERKA